MKLNRLHQLRIYSIDMSKMKRSAIASEELEMLHFFLILILILKYVLLKVINVT